MVSTETSSDDSDIDDEKALNMIHSKNPFVKLMIVGKINNKIKGLISKDNLT
jgi:hypothetical protein